MRKMSCRRHRCGPFDTFGHLLAEMGVPGSSRIVRNTCFDWRGHSVSGTNRSRSMKSNTAALGPASDPETLLLRTDDAALIARAMSNLPDRFRELLVLRELEGLSCRELADVMGMRIGTVMSGLSCARRAPRGALRDELTHRAPVVLEYSRVSAD